MTGNIYNVILEDPAANLCPRIRPDEASTSVVGLDPKGQACAVEPAEPQAFNVDDAADLSLPSAR